MGALNNGALTVQTTLNNLYSMKVAKTRNSAIHPVRGIYFTAVIGHLEAHVLLGNCKAIVGYVRILEYKVGKHSISKDEQ